MTVQEWIISVAYIPENEAHKKPCKNEEGVNAITLEEEFVIIG